MVVSVQQVAPAGRVMRRPQHTFQLRTRPWQVQPFFISPVLPGETLKNLTFQARVRTDLVKSGLIGWWAEFYFFYVKLRDLDGRDAFEQMILTPNYSLSAFNRAANASTYHAGPGIDWTYECLKRVVAEYFRDEGEAWDVATLDGLPMAAVMQSSWLDSAKLESEVVTVDDQLPGPDQELPDWMTGWADHFAQWQQMVALKVTDATFEDWLRSFGVKPPKPETETHKPELVRYVRDWAMPADDVAIDGTPCGRLRWQFQERADKDRFFREPGFLFGVAVQRPKVYLGGQKGSAVSMLRDAYSFLPAVMSDYAYTSLKEFATSTGADGPLGNGPTGSYWVDIRDLYLYGDQFANFDLAGAGGSAGAVNLPTSALARRFPASADINALFMDAGANKAHSEGVVSLSVLGTQVDHT